MKHCIQSIKQIAARLFFIYVMVILPHSPSVASELYLAMIDNQPGKIAVFVDNATALAGIKVSINYNKDQVKIRKVDKTKETSPFIHTINDNDNGFVIVVMASPTGISGKNVPLFNIEYVSSGAHRTVVENFTLQKCQLVGQDLKEIPCTPKAKQVIQNQQGLILPHPPQTSLAGKTLAGSF